MIIAERVLKHYIGDREVDVPVSIHLPVDRNDHWQCDYEIGWPAAVRRHSALLSAFVCDPAPWRGLGAGQHRSEPGLGELDRDLSVGSIRHVRPACPVKSRVCAPEAPPRVAFPNHDLADPLRPAGFRPGGGAAGACAGDVAHCVSAASGRMVATVSARVAWTSSPVRRRNAAGQRARERARR
jgi:hypothetical protein